MAEGLPYNRIDALSVGDELMVLTYEGEKAAMVYQLSRDLAVKSVAPSDTYWTSRPRTALRWPPDPLGSLAVVVRTWAAGAWTTTTMSFDGPTSPARSTTGTP